MTSWRIFDFMARERMSPAARQRGSIDVLKERNRFSALYRGPVKPPWPTRSGWPACVESTSGARPWVPTPDEMDAAAADYKASTREEPADRMTTEPDLGDDQSRWLGRVQALRVRD